VRERFAIATGTATVCVFDLEALKHRVADYADWWSDEDEELKEVNAGNVLFVALGSDGRYDIEVRSDGRFDDAQSAVAALLVCPSGRLFVGPGEDVSGGDLEPDRRRTTGRLLTIPSGRYWVEICRLGSWAVGVTLAPAAQTDRNSFDAGLSITE
jgi:hypothetical protein